MKLLAILSSLLVPAYVAAAEPKTRCVRFTYEVTIVDLKPNQVVSVWLPIPPTTEEQTVLAVTTAFPVEAKHYTEANFGNKMFFLQPQADAVGTILLRVVYTIQRKEVLGETDKVAKDNLELLLKPDPFAPVAGKHLKLLEGKKLPEDQTKLGRTMYEIVNEWMRYAKEGTEWGRGDVNWVCDSKFGNCTDFHSLFIALMRSQKVPAKFEMGFSLPEQAGEIPGYHCWAKFKPLGRNWIPVDISEANKNPKMKDYYFGNLTADRVQFTTGRSLVLEPKQAGPALNFFIYPYVELAGKPLGAEQIKRRFAFEEVKKR